MKSLVYYELKKIFGWRRTLILAGAVLLVCLASYWFTCLPTLLGCRFDRKALRERENSLSSDRIPAAAAAAGERRQALLEDPASYKAGVLPGEGTHIWEAMKPEIKKECEKLENILTAEFVLNNYDGYTQTLMNQLSDPAVSESRKRLLEEEIALRRSAGVRTDGYNAFYYYMILFFRDFTPVLLGFGIIVLLAPVFTREKAARTDPLILASRRGKRGVVLAKYIASFAAVTILFAATIGFYACLVGLTYGFDGGGTSCLFSFTDSFLFSRSPFHFTMAQLLGLLLAVSYAGCLGLAALVLFLSAHVRNGTAGVIISFTAYYVPLLLYFSTNGRDTLPLGVYFYSGLIQAVSLFSRYDGQILLGRPVWNGFLALGILAFLTMGSILLTFRRGRRRQVGE